MSHNTTSPISLSSPVYRATHTRTQIPDVSSGPDGRVSVRRGSPQSATTRVNMGTMHSVGTSGSGGVGSPIPPSSPTSQDNSKNVVSSPRGMHSRRTGSGSPAGSPRSPVPVSPQNSFTDKTSFNGVGTLSYEDGTVQEGTFINGRLDRFGTTYFPDGSVFSGLYKEGVPSGKGSFRTPDNEVSEGVWVQGRMNGAGMHRTPEVEYHGNFKDGLFHGQGSWKKASGDSYTGEWNEGSMHGYGVFTFADGTVQEGSFLDDLLHGRGTSTFPNGSSYVGMFQGGKPHGRGRFTLSNGDYSEGEWIDGKMTGQGMHVTVMGLRYEGDFVDGTKHGYGRLLRPNGSVYEGEWQLGNMTGRGEITYADNSKEKGEFVDGVLQGHGTMLYTDGTRFEGYFQGGKPRGFGSLSLPDGSWMQGVWKHGKLHGEATFVAASGSVYSGRFRKGLKDGPAIFAPPRSDFVIRGIWSKGSLEGPCAIVYDDGKEVSADCTSGTLKIGAGVGLTSTPSLRDPVPAALPQSPGSKTRHPASPRLVELLERAAAENESLRRVQKAKREALLAMERTPEVDKRLDELRLQVASLERVQADRIAAVTKEGGPLGDLSSPLSASGRSSPSSTSTSPSSVGELGDEQVEDLLPPRVLVRTVVRVRPKPRKKKDPRGHNASGSVPTSTPRSLVIVGKNTVDVRRATGSSKLSARFKADAVFGPEGTQTQLFEASGVHMIASALMGLNTTLLAWGGRATGKSYTLFGESRTRTTTPISALDPGAGSESAIGGVSIGAGLSSANHSSRPPGLIVRFLERMFKELSQLDIPPDSPATVSISVATLAVRAVVDALPTKDGSRRSEGKGHALAERTIQNAEEGAALLDAAMASMSQYTPFPSATVLVQVHLRGVPGPTLNRHTVTSFVDVATPIAAQDKSSSSALRTLSSRICNFLSGKRTAKVGDSADLRWASLFEYIFASCWRLYLVCHLNPTDQAPSEVHATLACAQSIRRHRATHNASHDIEPGEDPSSPLIPQRSSVPRVNKLLSGRKDRSSRSAVPPSPRRGGSSGNGSGNGNSNGNGGGGGNAAGPVTNSPSSSSRKYPRGVESPSRRARLSTEDDGDTATPPITPRRRGTSMNSKAGHASPATTTATAGQGTGPADVPSTAKVLTSTPHCRVNAAHLKNCRRGSPANIIVTAFNDNGQRQRAGGDSFHVTVAYSDQPPTPVPVIDHQDGSYTALFTPVSSGQYTIAVMRYGLHIQGSPFTITVPREKEKPGAAASAPPIAPPLPGASSSNGARTPRGGGGGNSSSSSSGTGAGSASTRPAASSPGAAAGKGRQQPRMSRPAASTSSVASQGSGSTASPGSPAAVAGGHLHSSVRNASAMSPSKPAPAAKFKSPPGHASGSSGTVGAAHGVTPLSGPAMTAARSTRRSPPSSFVREARLSEVSVPDSDVSEHVHSTYFLSDNHDEVHRVHQHAGYNIKMEHGRPLEGGLPRRSASATMAPTLAASTLAPAVRSGSGHSISRVPGGTPAPHTAWGSAGTVQAPATMGSRRISTAGPGPHPHTFRPTSAMTRPAPVSSHGVYRR